MPCASRHFGPVRGRDGILSVRRTARKRPCWSATVGREKGYCLDGETVLDSAVAEGIESDHTGTTE